MKVINTIMGLPIWRYWRLMLFIAGIVILAILIFLLVKKIRSKPKEPEDEKPKEAPGLPPHSLVKAWKGFLGEIPSAFRRIIMVYQQFVVFGESGAGKSVLINNHTDWQGHARQFYPSYTGNPLLQVYLGSKVLVQEIPASILNDTSKAARIALMKLWSPLFRRKEPTAVIVLNSASFQTDDPQYMKKQAQMMRGKVNLLARIRKKAVACRLVVTNMEVYDGFTEFSEFLARHNIPLRLEFSGKEDLAKIESCLTPYEEHLSRALISLPADHYLKIMNFLDKAPELFQSLSKFIGIFQSPDPLTPDPEITNLSLAFLSDEHTSVSNPFATTLTSKDIQRFNPMLKHKIAAAVLGVIGAVYLTGVFIYEYRKIEERYANIEEIERAPLAQYNQNMHRLFVDSLTAENEHVLTRFVPDFFPQVNRAIFDRGVENIQNYYILPELEKFAVSARSWDVDALGDEDRENSRNKVLYLLGLLYATRNNELGGLITGHVAEWADNTGLSSLLVKDYVQHNLTARNLTIDVNDYIYRGEESTIDDPLSIMVFFEKVKKLYFQPVISDFEFREVRNEAEVFLAKIRDIKRYDLSVQVTELLQKEALLAINTQEISTAEFKTQIQQEGIVNFLRFIQQSRIVIPEQGRDMNLTGLYDNLKVMNAYKGSEKREEEIYQFVIAGRDFRFGSTRWNELLNRTRMSRFINDFIDYNQSNDGLLFFQTKENFPALVMNATNNGMFLFKGQTSVDGRFTRSAFEKRVKPVVTELPKFIEALPLAEKDKNRFYEFLFKEIDAYGQRYVSAYQDYYLDFSIEATSEASLRYVLTQLTSSQSPLMEILMTVKANTNLEFDDNVYLFSLARKLEMFDFLNRLLVEEKGVFIEIEKYKAIVAQVAAALDMPLDEKNMDRFKARLSPIGRISYDVLTRTDESYLKLLGKWMDSVGIPEGWRSAFASPIHSTYYIGLPEVENEIATLWYSLHERDIRPLRSLFPFDRTSANEANPETLGRASHPKGHFWRDFRADFSKLFIEELGKWRLTKSPLEPPKIPSLMIPTLNAVSVLTENLWTKQGTEKPMEFMMKAYPLDKFDGEWPVVSLSFIHSSDSSIFGFNQQPSWKRVRIPWAREGAGSVGLELVKADRSSVLVNAVEVGRSAWNFFHLLLGIEDADSAQDYTIADYNVTEELLDADKGEGRGLTVLSWMIPRSNKALQEAAGRDEPEKGIRVQFAIDSQDPWAIFRLP